MLVARQSRRIALQSAITGMVLSISQWDARQRLLPAAAGALLQEIDLTVILNALRHCARAPMKCLT
jgi:hypothetical protein